MMGSNVLSIGASVTGIMPAITVRKLVTEAKPRKGLVAAPGAGLSGFPKMLLPWVFSGGDEKGSLMIRTGCFAT